MIFYSIYYLSIVFFLFTDYLFRNIKLFLFLVIGIVIFISGTRYNTGYDFYNYHVFYTHHLDESLEPLFKLSVQILNLFSEDSQLMFFIYSFATILLTYFAITKMTKYKKTSLFIFLLIPGLYLNTFSIIRQGIAEVFFLLAVYYFVYENKNLKFWFFSLIAIGFHYSAALPVLLIYFFRKILSIKYSIPIYLILLSFSIFLYKINIAPILIALSPGKFGVYVEFIQNTSLIKILVYNLFIVVLIIFKKQYIKAKSDLILLNFLFVGVLILNVFADFIPVTRLSYYFFIFQIILVPKFIYSFKDNNLKVIVLFLSLLYYILIFLNALYVDSLSSSEYTMTPYQNYFFKD